MNQAASRLAYRKGLSGATGKGRLLLKADDGTEKKKSASREWIVAGFGHPPVGATGSFRALSH